MYYSCRKARLPSAESEDIHVNYPQIPNLLRRTSAAVAAIAGILIGADLQGAQISLSSGTSTCTYNGMTVTPAGDFTVTCTTTAPPAPGNAGQFALSSGTLALQVSTSSSTLVVTRSGGTTDAISVPYSITSGATPSCNTSSGALNFAPASSTSRPIAVTATTTWATCTGHITRQRTG